jgi:hypothetical protein
MSTITVAPAAVACDTLRHGQNAFAPSTAEEYSALPTVTKPQLPPCSVLECPHSAGAVVNGRLLCGAHASEALSFLQKRGHPPRGKSS